MVLVSVVVAEILSVLVEVAIGSVNVVDSVLELDTDDVVKPPYVEVMVTEVVD